MNLNEHVYFRPTEEGEKVVCAYWNVSTSNESAVIQGYPRGDRWCMQLWEFCAIFGSHFSNGGPLLIEKNELEFG